MSEPLAYLVAEDGRVVCRLCLEPYEEADAEPLTTQKAVNDALSDGDPMMDAMIESGHVPAGCQRCGTYIGAMR